MRVSLFDEIYESLVVEELDLYNDRGATCSCCSNDVSFNSLGYMNYEANLRSEIDDMISMFGRCYGRWVMTSGGTKAMDSLHEIKDLSNFMAKRILWLFKEEFPYNAMLRDY